MSKIVNIIRNRPKYGRRMKGRTIDESTISVVRRPGLKIGQKVMVTLDSGEKVVSRKTGRMMGARKKIIGYGVVDKIGRIPIVKLNESSNLHSGKIVEVSLIE